MTALLAPSDSPARSFFFTGGSIPKDAACYVGRRADVELFDSLARGEFCYVLTARQMGKSSLMVRTATRLRREGVTVALLDLTAVGQNLTAIQWYKGLLGRLGRQLGIEEELEVRWKASEGVGPLQRWTDTVIDTLLARFSGPIVVFIDEIDAVRSLPFSADELFGAIRECYNRRADDPRYNRLTFCLLGVASPSELIADPKMTPFNIGKRIALNDFTAAEAAPLAQGLAGGVPVLSRILHWTGGHPYLTQRLCKVAEETGTRSAREVDHLCERLFFGRGSRVTEDNLLFVSDRLLRSDTDPAALLTLYGRIRAGKRVTDGSTGALREALRLSGVVRMDERGLLRVRNRIYARTFDLRWVREHLPDTELQRQRAAYRRGLLRASAISGAITLLFGGLAWEAATQARVAHDRDTQARDLLYAADMNLAQQAMEQHNVPRVLELLADHAGDPRRGFAYGYLSRLCHRERVICRGSAGSVQSVAYSPDGRLLVGASADGTMRVWDGRSEEPVRTLSYSKTPLFALAYSPIGTLLAAGGPDGSVVIWDVPSWHVDRVLRSPVGMIFSVAFSPDGRLLATAGSEGTVLWDTTVWRPLRELPIGRPGRVNAVAFSPDGGTLATAVVSAGGSEVRLWNTASGRALRALRDNSSMVYSVAFSPNGRVFASGEDRFAVLWDVARGTKVKAFERSQAVRSVAFSPDGCTLAAGSGDSSVALYDLGTGDLRQTLDGHADGVASVVFSPDGTRLASGASDKTARVWDVTADRDDAIRLTCPPSGLMRCAFSPDGRLVATMGGDQRIAIHDADRGRRLALLPESDRRVVGFAFSSDGARLLVGGDNQRLYIYDAVTGKETDSWAEPYPVAEAMAESPDGQLLATGAPGHPTDANAHLWAPAGHAPVIRLSVRAPGSVSAAAFSRGGRTLATGGPQATVILWDWKQRRELKRLRGHRSGVQTVAFSPDDRELATGSADGTVKLWEVAQGREALTLNEGASVLALSFMPTPGGGALKSIMTDGVIRVRRAW